MSSILTVTLAAGFAGALAGALASLVPGLHVNTVAALGLVAAGTGHVPPGPLVTFLLGALGAATFASIIPLVVLGVPEGEDAPSLLPGQRLARQGRTRHALTASATGSLAGLGLGTVLAGLAYVLLTTPGRAGLVGALTPWVAAAGLAVLVLSDPSGWPRAGTSAVLAGTLGVLALDLPVASPWGLPASVLLPLFVGLFGLPALVDAARAGAPPAPREPVMPAIVRKRMARREPRHRPAEPIAPRGPLLGSTLGLVAGTFSGFTAGPATAVAVLVRRGSDEELLATTSAVNTAAACVATGVLHATGNTRSGVHVAQLALGAPLGVPEALVGDLATLTLGASVGLATLTLVAARADRLALLVPMAAKALVPCWVALVVAFTGWPGLLVGAAAWAVARAGRAMGTRRAVLMAVLLVPALARTVPGLVG